VAILRAGELIEVGTLAEMRHLSALSVDATFDTDPAGPVADPAEPAGWTDTARPGRSTSTAANQPHRSRCRQAAAPDTKLRR
jgi:hypothetical protein